MHKITIDYYRNLGNCLAYIYFFSYPAWHYKDRSLGTWDVFYAADIHRRNLRTSHIAPGHFC